MKYRILLSCNAGLSTSMLVEKMKESASAQGIDADILAVSANSVEDYVNDYDVILLGPQVRFMKKQIESRVSVPVDVIDGMDYGMLEGGNVLKQAMDIIDKGEWNEKY